MAKGFLGLALTTAEIRYVYVEKTKRTLFLSRKGKLPAGEEISSPVSFSSLIKEIVTREKIFPVGLFFSILRPDIVIHQSILPKMPEAEVAEVVFGEIENIPSFAEKKFDYVYTTTPMEENKIKAIYSALPRQLIDDLIASAEGAKVSLESLEISPLNLLPLVYKVAEAEEQALIAVEEKASYIMIFSHRQCKFFFITAMGKSDLYPRSSGVLNDAAFHNWMEEIKRVFKSFALEHRTEAPQAAWLLWDTTGAAGLDGMVSQELGRQVRRLEFSLFDNVKLASEEEVSPVYLTACAPIISFAERLRGEFFFDKFLAENKLKRAVRTSVKSAVVYLVVVGLILGLVAAFYASKQVTQFRRLQGLNEQIATLKKNTEQLRVERNELLDIKERLLKQGAFVSKLNRISWSKVFGEVATKLPEGLALSSFKISESGRVEFKGEAFRIESVSELMRRIEHISVLDNAKFDFLSEREVEGKRIFTFGILAQFAEPQSSHGQE